MAGRLYLHPAFRVQFDALTVEVETFRQRLDPKAFAEHPKARLLARIVKSILEDIPREAASAAFELGNTLGPAHRHWRRAKFNQRFRLFFRYRSDAKVIVYAWMNDENTLRTRGTRNDAYAVFARRLQAGEPPDSFDDLLSESSWCGAADPLSEIVGVNHAPAYAFGRVACECGLVASVPSSSTTARRTERCDAGHVNAASLPLSGISARPLSRSFADFYRPDGR